ncbi:MAG: molybdenum cofactor guanylyltransferase MobA [Georgfuchsia sp.]
MASSIDITGLILAGGRSTRMGGLDKALLPLNGRPMIEWVIDRFRPQVSNLILNTNSDETVLAALGYPIIADAITGYPGPLAGLHAGMGRAETPLLACVPCDAPLLPCDMVVRLHQALAAAEADIAVACTSSGLQPTFLLCSCTLRPSIEDFLSEGGRAFRHWLARLHCIEVPFPDETAFSNINTPQDMERIAIDLSRTSRNQTGITI